MANYSTTTTAFELPASVWREIVGTSVQIPSVNSHVYYFPEGHHEQLSSSSLPIQNYNFTLHRPVIPCVVLSLRFLSDPSSDVIMRLRPLSPFHPPLVTNNYDNHNNQNDVVSFAKVLAPSDANVGGLLIPRSCADLIFPPLEFNGGDASPRDLRVRDARGVEWVFKHVYRGIPRRHVLSSGWCRFIRAHRLAAGDVVVFVRRRSTGGRCDGRRITGCGREVLGAIEKAAMGMEFEVVCYPRVEEAMRRRWAAGTRVRMAVDGEDLTHVTWMHGTVTSCDWVGSPWRMLRMNWDDPEGGLNNRVCPWQVDIIPLKNLSNSPNYLSPSLVSMHDARRDHIRIIEPTSHELPTDDVGPGSPPVSTVLRVESLGSDVLSPSSMTNVLHDRLGQSRSSGSGGKSFRLFGKTIQTSEPNL